MRKILFLLLLSLIIITSCDKPTDIVLPKKSFLKLIADPNLVTNSTDDWILASNPDGDWLDIQPYEAGQTVELSSSNTNITSVVVHFVSSSRSSTGESHTIFSYTDVPKDYEWSLKPYPSSNGVSNKVGTLNLSISNYSNSISTIPRKIAFTDGYFRPLGLMTQLRQQVDASLSLYQNSSGINNIFVSSFNGITPVYLFLKNIPSGTSAMVKNFSSDFKPLENIFDINYPNNTFFFGQFSGYYNGGDLRSDGYVFSEYISNSGGVPSIKLGYSQGFDIYRSIVSVKQDKRSRTYFKLGTPITSVALPDHQVTFQNKTIQDFSATLNEAFQWSRVNWRVNEGVPLTNFKGWNWYFVSKNAKFKVKPLPNLILDKYPFLDINKLQFLSIEFSQYLDGLKYEDLLVPFPPQSTHYFYSGFEN
jgi:hypothetical protein